MRGDVMRLSNSSRATGLFSVAGSWSSLPPIGAENTCLPSMVTMKWCGVSWPSTPTSPSATVFSSRPENTYSPSAGNVMTHQHAAARAERQPVHVLVLRDDGADRVGGGARLGAGIADGELGDPQGRR